MTPAGTSVASQDKPPIDYGRTIHVISGTNGIQLDIPRTGLTVNHRLDTSDRRYLPKFTSPTISDNKHEKYNNLGKDLAMGTRVVYDYPKNNGVNSLTSNNTGKTYRRVNTPGGKPSWPGESNSVVDNDYKYKYNHIIPGAREGAVRFRSGELSEGSSVGDRYDDCDVSRDDENSYRRLLRAASRKLRGFTDQREQTLQPYNHVTGDVHRDYDRVRQGDRNMVIGYDYHHFV